MRVGEGVYKTISSKAHLVHIHNPTQSRAPAEGGESNPCLVVVRPPHTTVPGAAQAHPGRRVAHGGHTDWLSETGTHYTMSSIQVAHGAYTDWLSLKQ